MNAIKLVVASLATVATSAVLPREPLVPRDTTFTLSDIYFHSSMVYSTPAHLATYGGYISFNLTNPSVPYVTACSATGVHLQDYFYGEIIYTCTKPEGTTGDTTFTFSRPDNSFNVNQTWQASEGAGPTLAVASGKADLSCQTTNWQNQNWTMGQLYSTTNVECQPATLVLPAKSA